MDMHRVMVIGCGGSGKSTFAKKLHAVTGLPVIHLDQMYWKANWVEPDVESWKATMARLIERPAWIMDGNYGGTMDMRIARADTIVYMDYPTLTRLWRVVRRTFRHLGRTRADMPAGCPERFQWSFIHYVATFNRSRRPRILEKLRRVQQEKLVVILRSNRDVTAFLEKQKGALARR